MVSYTTWMILNIWRGFWLRKVHYILKLAAGEDPPDYLDIAIEKAVSAVNITSKNNNTKHMQPNKQKLKFLSDFFPASYRFSDIIMSPKLKWDELYKAFNIDKEYYLEIVY